MSEASPEPNNPLIDRRTALRVGGGGALALLIGLGAGALDRRGTTPAAAPATSTTTTTTTTTSSTTTTTTEAPVTIPEIGEVDPGIVQLGGRVLDATGERDLDTLLRRLPTSDDDPLAAASAVVQAEFAAGTTVMIDGWVLARSEADAAAVVALLCAESAC